MPATPNKKQKYGDKFTIKAANIFSKRLDVAIGAKMRADNDSS